MDRRLIRPVLFAVLSVALLAAVVALSILEPGMILEFVALGAVSWVLLVVTFAALAVTDDAESDDDSASYVLIEAA